jgi:DNA-binding transcriptional LysR family regulator
MSFTIRQLEVFVEAARDCNFRKTADRLGISQPSISNQIRALEQWAGGALFHRSRGMTPRLSSKGTAFLEHAQQLLASGRRLRTQDELQARKEPTRFRVAAGPYLLDHYIRPALPRFLAQHDDVVLDFLPPGAAKNMRLAVRSGEADVAVFTAARSARRLAGAELVCETPCSLYGNVRFARLAAKAPQRIASLPFILPPEATEAERWMLATLKKAGIEPQSVIARSQFADVIADMVIDGRGIAILFDEHMAPHVRAGRVQRLGPTIDSASRVIVSGPKARGRAAAPFMDFLRYAVAFTSSRYRRAATRDR